MATVVAALMLTAGATHAAELVRGPEKPRAPAHLLCRKPPVRAAVMALGFALVSGCTSLGPAKDSSSTGDIPAQVATDTRASGGGSQAVPPQRLKLHEARVHLPQTTQLTPEEQPRSGTVTSPAGNEWNYLQASSEGHQHPLSSWWAGLRNKPAHARFQAELNGWQEPGKSMKHWLNVGVEFDIQGLSPRELRQVSALFQAFGATRQPMAWQLVERALRKQKVHVTLDGTVSVDELRGTVSADEPRAMPRTLARLLDADAAVANRLAEKDLGWPWIGRKGEKARKLLEEDVFLAAGFQQEDAHYAVIAKTFEDLGGMSYHRAKPLYEAALRRVKPLLALGEIADPRQRAIALYELLAAMDPTDVHTLTLYGKLFGGPGFRARIGDGHNGATFVPNMRQPTQESVDTHLQQLMRFQ